MYVSAEGIQPDGEKVKAISDMATPTKVDEVRRFLGMAGYI